MSELAADVGDGLRGRCILKNPCGPGVPEGMDHHALVLGDLLQVEDVRQDRTGRGIPGWLFLCSREYPFRDRLTGKSGFCLQPYEAPGAPPLRLVQCFHCRQPGQSGKQNTPEKETDDSRIGLPETDFKEIVYEQHE